MKNFEKYEKELKEMFDTENLKYDNDFCPILKTTDVRGWIKWLYEEYKEPLLTDKERVYLKAVIEPFRDKVKCIAKGNYFLFVFLDGKFELRIPLGYGVEFKQLSCDCDIVYSLEELGL